jgi:hypothetical protein
MDECHRAHLAYIEKSAEDPHHDNDKEGLLLGSVRSVKDLLVLRRPFLTSEKI